MRSSMDFLSTSAGRSRTTRIPSLGDRRNALSVLDRLEARVSVKALEQAAGDSQLRCQKSASRMFTLEEPRM